MLSRRRICLARLKGNKREIMYSKSSAESGAVEQDINEFLSGKIQDRNSLIKLNYNNW